MPKNEREYPFCGVCSDAALAAERDSATEAFAKVTATCQRLRAERDALREFVERVADGHPKDYTDNFTTAQALLDKFPTHQKTAV